MRAMLRVAILNESRQRAVERGFGDAVRFTIGDLRFLVGPLVGAPQTIAR